MATTAAGAAAADGTAASAVEALEASPLPSPKGTPVRDASLPILVIGLGHVGVAVVHRLHALGVPVQVLLIPSEVARHGAEFHSLGVGIIAAAPVWDNDLLRIDFQSIGAVVLAADNDSGNVDACLLIRSCTPDVPVLVRVSDPTLVRFLRMSVPHVEPYSMGSVIAPVAADMGLQMLGKRRPQQSVVRPVPTWVKARAALWGVLLVAGVLQLVLAFVLAQALGGRTGAALSVVDALASLWTGLQIGGLDHWTSVHRTGWLALTSGILDRVAVIAAVALLVDWLIPLRSPAALPGASGRLRDHIVILGAGNIGARVAELMAQRRLSVVVIERDAMQKNVQRLRSLGVHVVVGDATVDETLDLAGAWNAGALLALTNSDAVNLHVGLLMSDGKVGVPTVVRLLSPELNEHATRASDLTTVSPVAETASYICRTVERLRGDRGRQRESLPAGAPTPDPANRPTGRYAGLEFDQPGRATDQLARSTQRAPSSPRLPSAAVTDTHRKLGAAKPAVEAAKSASGSHRISEPAEVAHAQPTDAQPTDAQPTDAQPTDAKLASAARRDSAPQSTASAPAAAAEDKGGQ